MRLSWKDVEAQERDFRAEVRRIVGFDTPGSLMAADLKEEVDYEVIDDRFDYEYGSIRGVAGSVRREVIYSEGSIEVEFDDLEGEMDDEMVSFDVSLDLNDYESVNVAVVAHPVKVKSEVRTVPFRGESLTYTHYKITYEWETTGELDVW